MKNLIVFISLLLVLSNCETDFEINAPYDKIPIIYGVLDQSVDTQWIKINKSFLGTNNLAYPSINDSMYFDKVTVKVEEVDENGNVGNVYLLQSKFVPVAPNSGLFFTDQQLVYYFTNPLDETKDYRISGDGDGKTFKAKTNLIKPFAFTSRFRNSTAREVKLFISGVYADIRPEWDQSVDAESYDVVMRFHYTEHRSGAVYERYIDWKMGGANPTSFGELKIENNSEGFFSLLSNNKNLKDTIGVTKRVIGDVDFRITSSNLILKTYIDVSKPNSGIAFDKPDYTNIEGGRGIWASRYTAEIKDRVLSEKSVEQLYSSPYTSNFKFCSDNPAWGSDPYYCP